ncbi:MAG: OmpA family protein [Labilithrix sp.]|nr:OmpA family protein [Labilithrix sp.]MCW5832766.1 OmpA family protein [Labilithrix sp.]
MARKKKHPEHVNHERWLVSYADFITLLFAFFVVMFAVSQVDSKKVGRFTESFSKAVGIDMFPEAGHGLLAGASQGTLAEPEPAMGSPLPPDLVNLKTALSTPEVKEELSDVQILSRRNELVLRLSEGFLFGSGTDALEERALRVVARLAAELRDRPLYVRVEGHTDDRPIHTARFRSNWDLSTARATAVVARLAAGGISPERLSAAGYGEFHPLASNATDEGRKQNRRVDLVVSMPVVAVETSDDAPSAVADAGPATAPTHAAPALAPPLAPPPSAHPKEHP